MKRCKKKGVMDIEFIVSVMLFLTVLSFVSIIIISTIPKLHQQSFSEDLKAKAFQASNMLLFDEGEPADWSDPSTAERIGFAASSSYYLNRSKLSATQAYCSSANYAGFKDKVGLDSANDIMINIMGLQTGSTLLDCVPYAISNIRSRATINRVAVDSDTNELLIVTISIL